MERYTMVKNVMKNFVTNVAFVNAQPPPIWPKAKKFGVQAFMKTCIRNPSPKLAV